MRSDIEMDVAGLPGSRAFRNRREFAVYAVAFSWGLCAYFPVGVTYLHLLLLILALAIVADLTQRRRRMRQSPVLVPLLMLLGWTLLATVVGEWFPDTETRLFHLFRVALLLCLGLVFATALVNAPFRDAALGMTLLWLLGASLALYGRDELA